MRKLIIALSLLAICTSALAQEALQCVNPDVLNALIFRGNAESKLVVRRGMPEVDAGFRAPAGFTLVGNGVRGMENPVTSVAYKTDLPTATAFNNLLASLDGEGWKRENAVQVPMATFSVAGQQPMSAQLCRDGERRVVQMAEVGDVRYATIVGFALAQPRACNAPVPQQAGIDPIAIMRARQANLPRFSFPDTARPGTIAPDGEQNSGSTHFTTTRIVSPDSASSLARHLGRQLSEQGWRNDTTWNGKLGSGSTWLRRGNDSQPLAGMLEVFSRGDGSYDITFALTASR